MSESDIGRAYVPSEGPDSANVLVIGEAPGADEESEGRPFVGKAGQFLERYLNRVGVQRSEVKLSNLCKHRPKGNKFERLLGSKALQDGLGELNEEIQAMPNLNLVVALGNWPMYFTTGCTAGKGKPGTGIGSWRGSVVTGCPEHIPSMDGRKTLITYHPAFVIRPGGFGQHPVFLLDLQKIRQERSSPLYNLPQFEELIDPPHLPAILKEMSQSELLTVDIETFGPSLACVGVTDSIERGLCVTYTNAYRWEPIKAILETDQPKNFQYGVFDVNYLWWYYKWEVGGYPEGGHDTYIATANLFPEFKRGLAFLNSIYTPIPYYKEDRKAWRETGDLSTLWRYNIKDVVSQHWIALEQIKELEELYGNAS